METLPEGAIPPKIRSDNGSGFISKDFKRVLREFEVDHLRIKPHTPRENPFAERFVCTTRDLLAQRREPMTFEELRLTMIDVIRYYNEERLHSSLSFLTPSVWYRGNPEPLLEERRVRLAYGRQRRVTINTGRRQTRLMTRESSQGPQLWKPSGDRGAQDSQSA